MTAEIPFQMALVVVIVLTMSVTIYYRVQAASSGEKITHKDEGYLFAAMLRLAGLVLWISTFGYLVFPASFQWASVLLPTWLRWFGVVTGTGRAVVGRTRPRAESTPTRRKRAQGVDCRTTTQRIYGSRMSGND